MTSIYALAFHAFLGALLWFGFAEGVDGAANVFRFFTWCLLPDWVICGGESGRGARPMHVQWARPVVQQCKAAGVPVLVKQLGHTIHDDGMSSPGQHWPVGKVRQALSRRAEADPAFSVTLAHAKGGDWNEWPDDLRVREFPRGAE